MRRAVAYAVMVEEEVRNRAADVNRVETTLAARIERSRVEVLGAIDDLIQEVWRRAEGADARLATAAQHLADRVAELERQSAALVRLLVRDDAGQVAPGAAVVGRRVALHALAPGPGTDVVDRAVHHLRGLSPLADLGCGRGTDFLERAASAGMNAYGVDPDGACAARAAGTAMDVRHEDVLSHLRTIGSGALGGAFASGLTERVGAARLPDFLASLACALRPGGVAVLENADPAMFATHATRLWDGDSHPVPAEALAFLARAAGLSVVTVDRSVGPPLGGLDPVDDESAVANSLNAAVARLNEVLFSPGSYALVVSRPG